MENKYIKKIIISNSTNKKKQRRCVSALFIDDNIIPIYFGSNKTIPFLESGNKIKLKCFLKRHKKETNEEWKNIFSEKFWNRWVFYNIYQRDENVIEMIKQSIMDNSDYDIGEIIIRDNIF